MINLLSYNEKRQITAAKHNIILLKSSIFLLCALIFIILACWVASSFIQNIIADQTTSDNKSDESLSVLSQAETIESDILTANNAITQRVDYSNVITALTAAMPTGTIIDILSASSSTTSSPVQLTLHANDSNKGTELKANLDKTGLFTNVTVKSVASASASLSGYSYDITITFLINKATNI